MPRCCRIRGRLLSASRRRPCGEVTSRTFAREPALARLRSSSIRALYDDGANGVLIGSNDGLWRLQAGVLTAIPDQSCLPSPDVRYLLR